MEVIKKFLDKLFKDKDKNRLVILGCLFLTGVFLLALSKTMFGGGENDSPDRGNITPVQKSSQNDSQNDDGGDYEERLAKELAAILSQVDGAGEVNVMLTFAYGGELILAQDTTEQNRRTEESDGNGTSRNISESNSDTKNVITKKSDGSEAPIILKEVKPKVEGVIIIAKGGDDAAVKDALTRAAQTVLNVEIHKVQVLKMK